MNLRCKPALAAAAVVAALALTACSSSGGRPDRPGGGRAAATATAPSTVTARDHTVSRTTTRLRQWYRTATPALHRIDRTIVAAQRAAHHGDRAALHSSCVALGHAVDRFGAVPLAPDRLVRNRIARAMSRFRAAAGYCIRGDLTPAGPLVIRGQRAVLNAARRVGHLT